MRSGYNIKPEILKIVKDVVSNYYEHLEKANVKIDEEDYCSLPGMAYDSIRTSRTNQISQKTMMLAIEISEKKKKRDQAEAIVCAVKRGIERAAYTAGLENAEDLKRDLFLNMVDHTPRHSDCFSRTPKTFAKYRKRAYYYIADELGLLR